MTKEELEAIVPTLRKFEEELMRIAVGKKAAKHVSETIRAIKYVTAGLKIIENK